MFDFSSVKRLKPEKPDRKDPIFGEVYGKQTYENRDFPSRRASG